MVAARPHRPSESEAAEAEVAAFVAVGADEAVQRVVTAVHRLSKRLNQWYDAQLVDLGVSVGEWTVLSSLAKSVGPLTPSGLAELAGVAPSSMTHRLDRMVERELVTRSADPDNRTRVLVELAPAGRTLFAQAIRESNVVESDLLNGLDDGDRHTLAHLLEHMIRELDETDL